MNSTAKKSPKSFAWIAVLVFGAACGLLFPLQAFCQGSAPSITTVGRDPVAIGGTQYITGSGFGSSQGSSTLLLNGVAVSQVSYWSDSDVDFPVPAGTTTGSATIQVTTAGGTSNTGNFTVAAAPVVTGISPASGPTGTQVTFSGSNFGTAQGSQSAALLNGDVVMQVVSWSDTQVVAVIPSNVTAPIQYPLVLYANWVSAANTPTFSITAPPPVPSISAVGRNPVAIGGTQYITGAGFGSSQSSSTLLLNGVAVSQVSYWSDSEVDFPVPAGTTTGSATIQVTTAGGTSNTGNFTVAAAPVVTGISPASGPTGTQVTFSGSNFGTAQGSQSAALLNGDVVMQVVSWSDTQVVAVIPSDVTAPIQYPLVLYANWVSAANTPTFSITAPGPHITTISPASGLVGTQVTITGSGFGSSQGTGTVAIGTTNALIVSWNDTQVVAVVASGSTTGSLVVQQGGTQSNAVNFTVNTGPLLELSVADTPLQVNLSSPQNLDWIHWGRIDANTPDRKAGGTSLISDYTAIGGGQVLPAAGVVGYSWIDGNQQAAVSGTNADLQVFSGGGFQISVPADTTVKTLNLYALVQAGQAQVQASLSDGSAAAITDQSVSDLDISSKIYSIDFRAASAGQTLTVKLSASAGLVGLEAATLTPHFPVVTLASPAVGESFSTPGSVPLNAIAYQYDNSIGDVKFNGSNGAVLDQPNSPYTTTWAPLTQGHYSVSASVTDSASLFNTSTPVEFDVIGNGGSLSLQVTQTPASVNLTTQGTTDWVLWGAQIVGSDPASTIFDRKAAIMPLISNYTTIGNHVVYDANDGNTPPSFSYTDGAQSSTTFTQNMLYVFGGHDGYQITLPADTNQRTLQLYTGVNFGKARVTAFLSDGSAATVSDDSVNSTVSSPLVGNYSNALYSITYSAASAGQTLTVRYTLEQSYNTLFGSLQLPSGELYLMAATLSGVAPVPLAPAFTSVQPSSGSAGSTFTLTGSGFGAVQNDSALTVNGSPTTIVSWNDSQIVATVPSVPPGAYPVTLYGFAGPQFTVVPNITGLSPVAGPVGSSVTILGTGLGAAQGSGAVTFNGVPAVVSSWADGSITAVVPSGTTTGNVVVTTAQGTATNGMSFTVLPLPTITTISPNSGPPGTQVVITGSNFGATQGSGTVQIGNELMLILSWSDGAVLAVVPSGALTGNVALTAVTGGTSNSFPFVVNYGGPVLQFSLQDTPLQVNLTSPQNLDWVQWGRLAALGPDRKAGTTPLISNYTPVNGGSLTPSFGAAAFSWSDGQQNALVSESSSDVETSFSSPPGSGFQINVPADTSVKTLNLYVEVFGGGTITAQGLLQAALSDGSAAAISDQSIVDLDFSSKVYSIDFRAASPGQTLNVTFTALSGAIGLQAATLTPHLPAVSVASPTASESFTTGTTIPVSVTAAQFDSSILDVKTASSDGTVFDAQASPLAASWIPAAPGHYSITASGIDTAGLSNAAAPIEVDVIGQGGTLSIDEQEDFAPASPINLDDPSVADWILWGWIGFETPGNILSRKSAVTPLISDYTPIGNHFISSPAANNLCFVGNQQNYCSGRELDVHDTGNGFEIKVPADATPRSLQLYTHVNHADGLVTAFLSDGSAPVASEVGGGGGSTPPPAGSTSLYTINYSAASPGQTLTVRYKMNTDSGGGTIGLIGAALISPGSASTIQAPQITALSPTNAATNTVVTIVGTNFGAAQGDSSVRFGAYIAKVVTWTDTSIAVIVPAELASGLAVDVGVLTSHGDSNSVSFTLPAYVVYPSSLNLVVGQSASAKAKDPSGNVVTGLNWVAQDPTILSLSNDDPPLITGLTPGSTTVYAGDVPLPVTVYAGTSLPVGTPIWSVPLSSPGAGASLVPAVPSDNNIDIYAYDTNGVLSAISSDGELIWRHAIGIPTWGLTPDFSGNILVTQPNVFNTTFDSSFNVPVLHGTGTVNKVDSATGQLTPLYTYSGQYSNSLGWISGGQVVSGFNYVDGPATQAIPSPTGVLFIQDVPQVMVMNPSTGQTIAQIPIESSTWSCSLDGVTTSIVRDSISGSMIVAGDGNAYVPYVYTNQTDTGCPGSFSTANIHLLTHFMLLRVAPDGTYAKIPLNQLTYDLVWNSEGTGTTVTGSYLIPVFDGPFEFPPNDFPMTVITNADQGAAVFSPPASDCASPCQQTVMTLVTNDSVAAQMNVPVAGFVPSLQREDGSYIGLGADSKLDAVSLDGSAPWQTVLNLGNNSASNIITPQYATVDGGSIVSNGAQAVTVDQNGNIAARAQDTGGVLSWTGNLYGSAGSAGPSVTSYAHIPVTWAPSFWPFFHSNPSGNAATSDIPQIKVTFDSGNVLADGLHRAIRMDIIGPKVVLKYRIVQWMKGTVRYNSRIPNMDKPVLGRTRLFDFADWTVDAPITENITYPLADPDLTTLDKWTFEDDAGVRGAKPPFVVSVSLDFIVGVYPTTRFPFINPRLADVTSPTEPPPSVSKDWGVAGLSIADRP